MLGFVAFAFGVALLLTVIARFTGMTVRRSISGTQAGVLTLAFVAGIMALWWFATRGETVEQRLLAPLILPSPHEVLMAFPKLHFEQGLVRSILTSFIRVTVGFSLAAVVAVPLGVYMASFPTVSAFFRPLALASSYVPIVVFIPLTLAWWGASEAQKIGFLFIACFVALLPLVIKSISDVAPAYLDVALTKGATQWQLVREVLFPVAAADIWDHLRGVYGIGWGWIILAEVVAAQQGLGFLIQMSERRGHTNATFAIIIVIVAIAVVCDQAWRAGGRSLFPYRKKS